MALYNFSNQTYACPANDSNNHSSQNRQSLEKKRKLHFVEFFAKH